MSLHRCVYVSSARLDPLHQDAQIEQIVDYAKIANAAMKVTGTLIFDGSRFAQLLEGPEIEATGLARRIAIDPRHEHVVFLERQNVKRRLFDGFSMAYSGRSMFVARTIAQPLIQNDRRSRLALRQLVQLMLEFAR